MKRFFVFLFPIAMLAGCVKDNFPNGNINNGRQQQDTVKTDTRQAPDSVKQRANEYLKIDTTLKSIKFQFYSESNYCAIYEINAYRKAPATDSAANEYKAKVLDTLYLKATNYIFLGTPEKYNCDCGVIDVHFTDAYYWSFVM
jgi:hypothetical protein